MSLPSYALVNSKPVSWTSVSRLATAIWGQETNGAGGLFKGLRTIPVIFDIIKDVEELCPNAWVINFTNPAGMVTEAVLSSYQL
ncbi:phospho-beta-glucosidase B [Salmonella enterica subsp. enterica]|uniref:Phospho-beta-glucosidase B n=1 Tax=Salmonella enterica I TaxID=59201 RepID=A0A447U4M8_SALET|nr:phospho-beta-glucosidase B [Salmonella enterica subsp. enterica]